MLTKSKAPRISLKLTGIVVSSYQSTVAAGAAVLRGQSIFSASFSTTGFHRATSAASDCLNSSGLELSVGSISASINICLNVGSATIEPVACAICSITPIVVPPGARSPIEPITVIPAKPSSAAVGKVVKSRCYKEESKWRWAAACLRVTLGKAKRFDELNATDITVGSQNSRPGGQR